MEFLREKLLQELIAVLDRSAVATANGKGDFRYQCRTDAWPQHFLNFFPLPHGQGSLRPTLGCSRRIVVATVRSIVACRYGNQNRRIAV